MNIFSKKKAKIFCLSNQRSGTTSVGVFFKEHGFKVADWPMSFKNKWSYHWEQGNFEHIFNSDDFKSNEVFEDDPWWLPEFYKVLYHRFPGSKFILLIRDKDAWFDSMVSHSNGKVLGNTKRHCKIYRREDDFQALLEEKGLSNYDETQIDNLLSLEGYREHYTSIYSRRNREIIDFFKDKSGDCFFCCRLEDSQKWIKLADFMGLKIAEGYDVHMNKSKG